MAFSFNIGKEDQGNTFEPIPAGTKLDVRVINAEYTKVKSGKNADKPQLKFDAQVVSPGDYYNRKINFNYIALYPGSGSWATLAFADAIGLDVVENDDGSKSPQFPDNAVDLNGKVFKAKLRITTNQNGDKYNNVNGYAKADAEPEAVTKSDTSTVSPWNI